MLLSGLSPSTCLARLHLPKTDLRQHTYQDQKEAQAPLPRQGDIHDEAQRKKGAGFERERFDFDLKFLFTNSITISGTTRFSNWSNHGQKTHNYIHLFPTSK